MNSLCIRNVFELTFYSTVLQSTRLYLRKKSSDNSRRATLLSAKIPTSGADFLKEFKPFKLLQGHLNDNVAGVNLV